MSRLQSIENAISNINEVVFQELCDSFLALRNNNYSTISRVGSQDGKQKSKIGTPDTFLLLPNGKYIFVEHSTNITAGLKKLKDDIEKCIDVKKTGVSLDEIEEIIVCINFNLKANEINELKKVLENTRIKLSVITLDTLSIEINLHHRDLANKYLGLPLDSGQIVSLDSFIKEYNNVAKGISTPIDNTFMFRENELNELNISLRNNDFIILTGAPGVGKTKLSIEGVSQFLKNNLDYKAYCISYKHYTLLDDLFQYIDSNGNYLLFVDDANRIDAFNQITSFFKIPRKGKLKVIITVRDYAYEEISLLCREFTPIKIDIEKFSDEQIIEIIKQKPFEILNPDYHKEITKISDGNPRIAIMTSLLAKAKQNIYALNDVSELFENYFSTFIKDSDEFSKDINIKCLGLISFFYTIPFKDKKATENILKEFDISYFTFIDVIDRLDKLELVDIQFEHVKIPEQNLATYFFYKAFVKDDLLSFEVLLNNFYESNKNRFKDCVIPANNTFGAPRVMNKLLPYLKNYWGVIRNDIDKAFDFLFTFWFYLIDEVLEFTYTIIEDLPQKEKNQYNIIYDNNDFSYNRNRVLELLQKIFIFQNKVFNQAIELAFEYVRRLPEHSPELAYSITSSLTFDRDDEPYDFYRQKELFKILIEGFKSNDELSKTLFYSLSNTFLKYEYQHFKSGRNHSFYTYQYRIPNNNTIKAFRSSIWNIVNEKFIDNPNISFDFLKAYSRVSPEVVKDVMIMDVPFILLIIQKYLTNDSFEHCKYVQNQIRWFKRNSILESPIKEDISFDSLLKKFTNPIYEIYLKISWKRYRDKEDYQYTSYSEFNRLKEEEIRASFVFESEEEVKEFYKHYVFLERESNNEGNYNNSLDYIIDENYKRNKAFGSLLLKNIIRDNNNINFIPRNIFINFLKDKEDVKELWNIIRSDNYHLKTKWELSFYDYLDERLIDLKYALEIINTINEIQEATFIHFERLQRFLVVKPDLFQVILSIIIKKNKEGVRLNVWGDFFDIHFDKLGADIDLIETAYVQQDKNQHHFDYEIKGLLKILNKKPSFLVDYVESLYVPNEHKFISKNKRFNAIWEIENIEEVLDKVFELVIEKGLYLGILKHFCNVFFINLKEESLVKAERFLLDVVEKDYLKVKKINSIVDISRNSMKNSFEKVLLSFIAKNQNVDFFSKIYWRGSGGVYSGNVIIGDIEATQWKNILNIVEKSNVGIKLIPIKKYLRERIEEALRSGDWERKRRFLKRDY